MTTIFVCVKTRDKGKASCACAGSRELLEQLRAAAAEGSGEIAVRPTGCLKKCKKGPAVVLFQSGVEPMKKAPKKAWKKADERFKRTGGQKITRVLETALALAEITPAGSRCFPKTRSTI